MLVDPGGPGDVGAGAAVRRSRIPAEPLGPGRRMVLGSLVGAVVGGSILGLVVGVVAPPSPPAPQVIRAEAAPSATVTGAAAAPAPSRSASRTPAESIKTVRETEAAPPSARIEQPWRDRTLMFVTVEDIWREGDGMVLRVTPTTFLTGAKAKAWYAQQNQPAKDYAGIPEGDQVQYTVRRDAAVFGEYYLGDHTTVQSQQFSTDQLYDYTRGALDHGAKPTLWLKRTLGVEGPVIYVAEQYLG